MNPILSKQNFILFLISEGNTLIGAIEKIEWNNLK